MSAAWHRSGWGRTRRAWSRSASPWVTTRASSPGTWPFASKRCSASRRFRAHSREFSVKQATPFTSLTSRSTMAIRTIEVRERVMTRNDEIAARVRARLAQAGVPAFNLVSSPGSGKTALLERTLARLGSELRIAIVTGDVQTQNDADRLARYTDRLVQAGVTPGPCHLHARPIETPLQALNLQSPELPFIQEV